MKHFGDITKISGRTVPVVDCIIGGSPCQDLSIAGKRAGLSGERSGLFMDQIRIIKEMREHSERTIGIPRPQFAVWENVPGALSSNKGEDFRIALEEFCKIQDENAIVPEPPKGKWSNSGAVVGDGWSVAWRVLDAQFWGVPQRRRRIALVADFGGYTAPEILFERKSLFGNTQTGRTQGKETAGRTGKSAESTGMYIFKGGNGAKAGLSLSTETAPCLTAAGSGTNQAPTICIQGNCIDRADTADCNGKGWRCDKSYTLNTIDRHAVYDGRGNGNGTIAPTLTGDHARRVSAYSDIVMRQRGFGDYTQSNIAGTLKAHDRKDNSDLVVYALDCRNLMVNETLSATIQAKNSGGYSLNYINPIQVNKSVRRLTPLECERLQGYPDGWTNIGDWTDSKGKKRKTSDSARYKALGNSIALPPWKWVLKRLCAQYERDATMASLFDGIGGFPLLWEQLNGKGTCLWASEIEEFPMAVTAIRFDDTKKKYK